MLRATPCLRPFPKLSLLTAQGPCSHQPGKCLQVVPTDGAVKKVIMGQLWKERPWSTPQPSHPPLGTLSDCRTNTAALGGQREEATLTLSCHYDLPLAYDPWLLGHLLWRMIADVRWGLHHLSNERQTKLQRGQAAMPPLILTCS